MTLTGILTAVAVGKGLQLRPGQTATYSVTVDALETFNGLAVLQRSRDGGQTWQPVVTFDGTSSAIAPGTTSGTVENETTGRELYRFACLTATSAEELDFTLADAVDAETVFRTKAGVLALAVNDDGSITPTSITNLGTLVAAVLAALPTSDPVSAGALYLATGVVKVSAG